MGNKLKAISKISVALALLGAAVPAVEAAPTAMAAKKATKKAKKSTKKAAKKSTKKAKKAKKTTKKKSTKKAKKSTKKAVKKSTKKAKKAKKTTKKKATKKIAKKPAKKSVKKTTKKPVKKAVKKPVAKKPVKKAVKKPVAKKPVKKVAKKPTTKKPVKKVVKRVTMADKYQPKVKSGTVNLDWGAELNVGNLNPENFITNKSSLPSDVDFDYLDPFNTKKDGTYKTRIQAKYEDGSKEVVGTVTFVVPKSDADKYQPTVRDVTLNYGVEFNPRDAIANAPGYFPNDPALPQFDNLIGDEDTSTKFDIVTDPELDTQYPGIYDAQIEVEYPDGSSEMTKKFKITVLPSDADKAKVSLKSSNFTVSSNEALEHVTDNYISRFRFTLNDPTRFLNIGSALPEGTVIRFDNSELDLVVAPAPGKYKTSLTILFPDKSEYTTNDFIVNVK